MSAQNLIEFTCGISSDLFVGLRENGDEWEISVQSRNNIWQTNCTN